MTMLASAQQSRKAEVLSRESDGSYVVRIDGATMRAFSEDQLRELRVQQAELVAAKQERDLLRAEVEKQKALIANCDLREQLRQRTAELGRVEVTALEQERDKWKLLYEGEHELRVKTEGLVGRGRVTSFFDHPLVQVGFKALVPVANLILTSKRN
jgi:hypothetical protein